MVINAEDSASSDDSPAGYVLSLQIDDVDSHLLGDEVAEVYLFRDDFEGVAGGDVDTVDFRRLEEGEFYFVVHVVAVFVAEHVLLEVEDVDFDVDGADVLEGELELHVVLDLELLGV